MNKLKEWFAPEDPKELVRKWQATLRTDQRALDRQVRDIKFEEKKVIKSIKEAAKRGDTASMKAMAREIVHTKKTVNRIMTHKAQLLSINHALVEQLAMMRVSQAMGRSTEVMKLVSDAMKLPEIQQSMMEMSREMMKAGLIDEMMSDAMDSALDTEDMEEETEEQLQQVLDEIIGDTLAAMPSAQKARPAAGKATEAEEEEEGDDEMAELQSRLQAVKA